MRAKLPDLEGFVERDGVELYHEIYGDGPETLARGGASHPAMQRANAILCECIDQAELVTIDGAAHFMIATHAAEVAHLIAKHVLRAE